MNKPLYYNHSGNVSKIGAILLPFIGVLPALILGGLYSFLGIELNEFYRKELWSWNDGPLYLYAFKGGHMLAHLALLSFFASLMGHWIGLIAIPLKIRNIRFLRVTGFIVAILGIYWSWAVWLELKLGSSDSAWIDSLWWSLYRLPPEALFLNMDLIAARDSIPPFSVGAFTSYSLWILEAICIASISTLFATGYIIDRPFCEEGNSWSKKEILKQKFIKISDVGLLVAGVERDFKSISEFLFPEGESTQLFTRATFHVEQNSNSYFITLDAINVVEVDGKHKEKTQRIFSNLIINKAVYEKIKSVGG